MALQINAAELEWLEAYRQAIAEQYPGKVLRMLVYGDEARAYLFDDNELNVLLVTRDEDDRLESPLALLGYSLSDPPRTAPSITVWTEKDWERHKKHKSPFLETMEEDGVWLQSLLCYSARYQGGFAGAEHNAYHSPGHPRFA